MSVPKLPAFWVPMPSGFLRDPRSREWGDESCRVISEVVGAADRPAARSYRAASPGRLVMWSGPPRALPASAGHPPLFRLPTGRLSEENRRVEYAFYSLGC